MAKFTEVFSDETKLGHKIPTSEYLASGKFPIIDQGQWQIAGYTDLESGAFTDVPAIIFGDHTRIVKYVDTPFFLGADGVKVLKAKVPDVDYKYLFYCLQNAKIPNTGYNRHFKWLKELEIPLPPLEEQRHIAAVLDKVTDLIAQRRAQLDKLDLLVKSRFVEMFGDPVLNPMNWPSVPLSDMADIVSGITKGRKTKEHDLIEVPYMAVSNVKDGYIDWTTVKTIAATQAEIDQYRLLPDDVLMTEGGDPDKLGRGAIIKKPLENCIHQNHIFRVRLDEAKIRPVYFAEYLQHQKAKQYFLRCAKQTTGIASINMTQLKGLPTLVPPTKLQFSFNKELDQINKTKSDISQSLSKLEILKKSIMQDKFGG